MNNKNKPIIVKNIIFNKKLYPFEVNTEIKNLNLINLFFGFNSVGKSVISKTLALPQNEYEKILKIETEHKIKFCVFNKEYIKNKFEGLNIEGFQTFKSDKNKDIIEKIENLKKAFQIDFEEFKFTTLKKHFTDFNGWCQKIHEKDFRKTIFYNHRVSISRAFYTSIKDQNNVKKLKKIIDSEYLVDQLQKLNKYKKSSINITKDYGTILNNYENYDNTLQLWNNLKPIDVLFSTQKWETLDLSISQIANFENSHDIFAQNIAEWQKQDSDYPIWLKTGQKLYQKLKSPKKSICLFCQTQNIETKIHKLTQILKKIEETTTNNLEVELKTIEQYILNFRIQQTAILNAINNKFLSKDKVTELTDCLNKYEKELGNLLQNLNAKQQLKHDTYNLTKKTILDTETKINEFLDEIIITMKKTFTNPDNWKNNAKIDILKSIYFQDPNFKIGNKIDIFNSVKSFFDKWILKTQEYQTLEGKLEPEDEIVNDFINKRLKKYFFHFELKPKYNVNENEFYSYKITSSLKEDFNFSDLSDGEKNILCFYYFLGWCKVKLTQKSQDKKIIIVIDDPVSSLTGENMLLIRDEICNFIKPYVKNNQCQFIFLTHKFAFFNSLIFRHNNLLNKTSFYEITSKTNNINNKNIFKSEINQISKEKRLNIYHYFWRSFFYIKEKIKSNDLSIKTQPCFLSMPNIMRNILEYLALIENYKNWKDMLENSPNQDNKNDYDKLISYLANLNHSDGINSSCEELRLKNILDMVDEFSDFFNTCFKNHYKQMQKLMWLCSKCKKPLYEKNSLCSNCVKQQKNQHPTSKNSQFYH